jgi:hypothetical protein
VGDGYRSVGASVGAAYRPGDRARPGCAVRPPVLYGRPYFFADLDGIVRLMSSVRSTPGWSRRPGFGVSAGLANGPCRLAAGRWRGRGATDRGAALACSTLRWFGGRSVGDAQHMGAAGEGTRLSGKRIPRELVTWKPMAVIAPGCRGRCGSGHEVSRPGHGERHPLLPLAPWVAATPAWDCRRRRRGARGLGGPGRPRTCDRRIRSPLL